MNSAHSRDSHYLRQTELDKTRVDLEDLSVGDEVVSLNSPADDEGIVNEIDDEIGDDEDEDDEDEDEDEDDDKGKKGEKGEHGGRH